MPLSLRDAHTFWILQVGGWLAFALIYVLAELGEGPTGLAVLVNTIVAATGFAASLLLWLLYRRFPTLGIATITRACTRGRPPNASKVVVASGREVAAGLTASGERSVVDTANEAIASVMGRTSVRMAYNPAASLTRAQLPAAHCRTGWRSSMSFQRIQGAVSRVRSGSGARCALS